MTCFHFLNFTSCLRVKCLVLVALDAISPSYAAIKLIQLDNNKDSMALMCAQCLFIIHHHILIILLEF